MYAYKYSSIPSCCGTTRTVIMKCSSLQQQQQHLVLFFVLQLLVIVNISSIFHISSINAHQNCLLPLSVGIRSALFHTHYSKNNNNNNNKNNNRKVSQHQHQQQSLCITNIIPIDKCSSVSSVSSASASSITSPVVCDNNNDILSTDGNDDKNSNSCCDQYTESAFLLQYTTTPNKNIQQSQTIMQNNNNNEDDDDELRAIQTQLSYTTTLSAFLKKQPKPIKVATTKTTATTTTFKEYQLRQCHDMYTSELDFLDNPNSCNNNDDFDDVGQSTINSFSRNKNSDNRNVDDTRILLCKSSSTMKMSKVQQLPSTKVQQQQSRPLVFWENMICGAISRSVAQTTMHPANTMKTILQNTRRLTSGSGVSTTTTSAVPIVTIRSLLSPNNFQRLTVGAGANFILSVPHGAMNFAVLEFVRKRLSNIVQHNAYLSKNEEKFSFGLDFLSSSISTVVTSIVSTPQMMIVDNIMAGNYPNLQAACIGLAKSKGIHGFYAGWWPGLVGKIPSYALTWTFFQQLKKVRNRIFHKTRPIASDFENSMMGCMASAATVCLMIPMDTIKTRLVSQAGRAVSDEAYKGIIDCAVRVFREEGVVAFYRGLPPRLVSVVPMIGIQFGVYEFMKRVMIQRRITNEETKRVVQQRIQQQQVTFDEDTALEEAMMEVAASQNHPNPVPRISKQRLLKNGLMKAK